MALNTAIGRLNIIIIKKVICMGTFFNSLKRAISVSEAAHENGP